MLMYMHATFGGKMQLGHSEQPSSALTEQLPLARPGSLGRRLAAIHSSPAALSWLSQCHGTLLGSPADLPDRGTGRRVTPVTCWSSARELGGLMLEYARRTTDPERLDMAIALLRQACEDGPASGEARLINCCQLATALCARFDVCGQRADLDAAISVLERVCSPLAALTGEESFDYSEQVYLLLARSLQRRFELTGVLRDLDTVAEISAIIHAAQLPSRRSIRSLPDGWQASAAVQCVPGEGVNSPRILTDTSRVTVRVD